MDLPKAVPQPSLPSWRFFPIPDAVDLRVLLGERYALTPGSGLGVVDLMVPSFPPSSLLLCQCTLLEERYALAPGSGLGVVDLMVLLEERYALAPGSGLGVVDLMVLL